MPLEKMFFFLGWCLLLLLRIRSAHLVIYSGFLWMVPTDTGTFLRGLKL